MLFTVLALRQDMESMSSEGRFPDEQKRPGSPAERMELIARTLIKRAAHRFKLMGEPARLELLNALFVAGERNVQELVEATGLGQANVSKHLGLLLRGRLIARRQVGIFAYYRIIDPTLEEICRLVTQQLNNPTSPSSSEQP